MAKTGRLNGRQRLFCVEYLKDFNATQAAIRAGYSKKTAFAMGHENLKKPYIQDEVSVRIKDLLEQAKIPLEKQIFEYWMKRAFYDVTEIIDMNGNLKLSEEELREKGLHVCIDSVNKKISSSGKTIVVYEFASKDRAVEMLQKYIRMIKDKLNLSISGELDIKINPPPELEDWYSQD